jgi:ferredoxin-fold anticodon binding domain-containing protein
MARMTSEMEVVDVTEEVDVLEDKSSLTYRVKLWRWDCGPRTLHERSNANLQT